MIYIIWICRLFLVRWDEWFNGNQLTKCHIPSDWSMRGKFSLSLFQASRIVSIRLLPVALTPLCFHVRVCFSICDSRSISSTQYMRACVFTVNQLRMIFERPVKLNWFVSEGSENWNGYRASTSTVKQGEEINCKCTHISRYVVYALDNDINVFYLLNL